MHMQVALACLHEVAPSILSSNDLGSAISAAKESLVRTPVDQLVRRTLYEIPEITAPQLAEWRAHCHELVATDAQPQPHPQPQPRPHPQPQPQPQPQAQP